ncbi:MAG: bile acid:sodium symporter, partial [Candidatus Adiutrix sp.]|nr:bile acid:sodium symporter [Candidatus Adiutrix sp.]
MSLFEKLQTFFIIGSAAVGLLIGQSRPAAAAAGAVVTPALMCMLFGLFLGVPLQELRRSFFDLRFTLTSLTVNFIWTPALGWLLGGLFLADSPALRLGFVMLLVTPCTDWYLAFTAVARGNVSLSAAVLPLNLLLQVLLLPLYLFLFAGLGGQLDWAPLAKSVALALVLPFGLARAVRGGLKAGGRAEVWLNKIFADGQLRFLCLAICAMFASQAAHLAGRAEVFVTLLWPLMLFFIINFILVRLLARVLKFSFADSVSLSLVTLARNSPIALAIAVTAFPAEPLIALALVIGPLIELPFLGLVSQALLL